MQFLMTILYFVVTLGVLVFVHEFGHFIAAKIFRMRVDRFSIGFPPRAFGKQIGETDYCVSWIPIGGYVKIAGMIDESFDTDFLEKPPEPWEFRAKPIWQRMIVISAGVIMNILLAIVIFWGINYVQGSVVRETTTVGYVAEKSPGASAGFQVGDRILAVNGEPVTTWEAMYSDALVASLNQDVTFLVQRGTEQRQLLLSRSLLKDTSTDPLGLIPDSSEMTIGSVDPGKPADKLGLKPGDVLLSLNGTPIGRDQQKVRDIVEANAGKEVAVEWRRDTVVMKGSTVPSRDGRIGIFFGIRYVGPIKQIRYTLLEALPKGVKEIGDVAVLFVKQIWQVITGKTPFSQSVGGPIKIAQMATQSAEMGWAAFLGFMALLSVSLAILNILPFPALDGGHLAFLVYEVIFRREVPIGVKLGLQRAGFVLLLAFMAFVLYNDIVHF
ncbi:MAG: RIP metalloprotease RseP [Bacteroidota bacterium]